ncbi:hypothetical protein C8J55DRAFT_492207 [Lentinula edodes]|uniref:Uncharacterized protein n=1 Tax=Lentinula lateritia TaxID=40482 RepID=A0A9W9DG19_9AGAR|nr:hypothetical protein C8J55DRAFT_492205 [Lentinula edodes]KAJ4469027.1 hypothetical protein C8J55DRAFT_492207 [Lentinula edodes]
MKRNLKTLASRKKCHQKNPSSWSADNESDPSCLYKVSGKRKKTLSLISTVIASGDGEFDASCFDEVAIKQRRSHPQSTRLSWSRKLLKNSVVGQAQIWPKAAFKALKLDRINSLVPDPYAIPFLEIPPPSLGTVTLPTTFVAPPKPCETLVIPSLHPARFLTLQLSGITFVKTFHVILAGDRSIDFTMYLQKLLSIWDDDSRTWNAPSCPVVGEIRIAAKHWKVVFSKAGHWKASRNRTQWRKWKTFSNCPQKLLQQYQNSCGLPLTIRDIAATIRHTCLQSNKEFNASFFNNPDVKYEDSIQTMLFYEKRRGQIVCTSGKAIARRLRSYLS